MIRAGLQIPNFTYPNVPDDRLFERVAAIAVTGEQSGFDAVMVMDHFYQLPMLGPTELAMFESYSLLAALAARTKTAKLGTLVTGVTYRNPAILAKIVTTLDVISRGRAFLGIGAAWFDVEHEALGVDFPPVKERFERLEEALQICRAMFRSERPTITGKHYTVKDAINSPAPIQDGGPPIMIGGGGEKKTLKLVAMYADMVNLTAGLDEVPHKLDVLAAHCADVGRDIATINKTAHTWLVVGGTNEEANRKRDNFLAGRGMPKWDDLDEGLKGMFSPRLVIGDADSVGEQIQTRLGVGLDGLTYNILVDGHDLEAVAQAGEAVAAAMK